MSDIAVAESGTRLQKFLDRAGLRGFPWKTATILYTISWGWLFIVRNSYWSDDWNTLKFPQLSDFDYKSLGLAPWTSAIGPLHSILGPGFLRVFIFVSFFAIALTVFGISNQFSSLALLHRRAFALLFLLLPFNHIRVALMTFHYTSGILMFYLAWYLITTFKSRKIFCIGLVLFFLSFQMHSLLFFYLLPVTHFAYLSLSKKFWHSRTSVQLIALVAVPLTYVVLRYFFWPENIRYHSVEFRLITSSTWVAALLLCGSYLILICRFYFRSKINLSPLIILFAGVFCSVLALFPYLLGGFYRTGLTLPEQLIIDFIGRSEYRSRHLSLQPLGFAIGCVGLLFGVASVKVQLKNLLFRSLIFMSVFMNLLFGFEYWIDSSKQNAVVEALQKFENQNTSVKYQVFDLVPRLNAQAAPNRFIWEKLIAVAYGEDYAMYAKINYDNKCVPFDGSNYLVIRGPKNHFEGVKNWMKRGDFGFQVKFGVMTGRCLPEMARVSVKTKSWPIWFFFRGVDFETIPYPSNRRFLS